MKTKEKSNSSNQKKTYCLKIEAHLHKLLENRIFEINRESFHQESKQRWIVNALLEKIKNESDAIQQKKDLISSEKAKILTVRLDDRLVKKIEEVVSFYKKEKGSFSIKQFMLEAIEDRLKDEPS